MNHQLLVNVPDEIYNILISVSQKVGKDPEQLVIEGIQLSVQSYEDDPVEEFIGAFQSNINDWTENHDRYLGDQQI